MLRVNDSTFQKEVLDSEQPVLVKFSTEWCGPCKMLGQIIDEMEADGEEGSTLLSNFKVVEVDAEESVETCPQYALRAVPTVMIFNNGKPLGKPRIGAMQRGQLVELLSETSLILEEIKEEESELEEDDYIEEEENDEEV